MAIFGVAFDGSIQVNKLVVPAGTASSPSICRAGDPNTGIWFPADDQISLAVSGVDALRATTASVSVVNMPLSGLTTSMNVWITTPSATQSITAATQAITAGDNNYCAIISSTAAFTLTSAPTIADGTDGEEILIVNVGTNNITIQDQGTLANSNLRLIATTQVLGPRDSLALKFLSAVGDWVQIGAVVNVL